MAYYTSLYSGSSGNAAVIRENDDCLLIDLGKNCKQTCLALNTIGVSPDKLCGILITHEHSDHVGGLRVFLKKYNIPVYGGAATLDYLQEYNLVPPDTMLVAIDGRNEDIAGFNVTAFATSHDSVGCCGFKIKTKNGSTVSIATDLGIVTETVYNNLQNANLVALEANYDKTMLMFGSYPYYLKRRIASDRGHLCNDDTAKIVSNLAKCGCKKFALCHLSNENNTPSTAKQAIYDKLLADGVCTAQQLAEKALLIQTNRRNDISETIEF